MHPMIVIERLSGSPTEAPIFEVVIKYPAGEWRFKDRQWASFEEARADIPTLQATGRLPTDDELNRAD